MPKIIKSAKKTISLKTKLEIIRRCNDGEKSVNIAKALGLPATTIRSIKTRDADKIKKSGVNISSNCTSQISRCRSNLMLKMESLVYIWIQDQNRKKMPLNKACIQAKAKTVYDTLKQKPEYSEYQQEKFQASQGWFERHKNRMTLHNIGDRGEAASADVIAGELFVNKLKDLVKSEAYSPKQIFNVDETGLFWKRLPKRTFISREEKSAPGFKPHKDRITVLLGGNAEGDFKFKPFTIYASETPTCFKNVDKKNLPVHWRSNRKAWMTAATFRGWASKCAIPEIKRYCHNENISFKALILLDNAPSHPIDLDHIDENVRFVFMPPNTTSIIQPMDQGVISNFKAYYLRRSFKQLFTAVETDNNISIKDFWKNYNILTAVSNIAASWAEVSKKAMNGCWKSVWPECVEGASDNEYQSIDRISVEVAEMAAVIGLDGMETCDIVDLININSEEELDNDELFELDNNQSLSVEDEEPNRLYPISEYRML